MKKINAVEDLVGETLAAVEVNTAKDEIAFTLADGRKCLLWHSQDCCESVSIEDVVGDPADLVGLPLTMAEETTSDENPSDADPDRVKYQESFTWTFYRFATAKGYVTVRWYGSSNGYYSERVDFSGC